MTTPLDLQPIKEREARATKPPWFLGMLGSRFCLFRDAGMREIILDAVRKGMNDATLRLRDHRLGVMIPGSQDLESHPDAEYLRHARTDIPILVAEVERLRETMNQIISTTSEPVVKKFAEYALK